MQLDCQFHCSMSFYLMYLEQSQLGNMSSARTKILVTLVTQFGGPLKDGEILCSEVQ